MNGELCGADNRLQRFFFFLSHNVLVATEMAVSEDLVMNPRLICAAYREKLHGLFRETSELDGEFGKWQLDVHIQLFAIVAALLSWRDGQGLEIKWTLNWQYVAILSQTF